MSEEVKVMSESEKKKEDWMNSKWRPMMGWMYMLVCVCDFVLFPILWSLVQTIGDGKVESQWMPITLQGAGLFHIAMGAVLGIAAMGRTQEKMAGANNGGVQMSQPSSPSFMPSFSKPAAPAPSFNNTASATPAFTPAPATTFGAKPTGPGQAPMPEL
jgi:hypothetical protein